VSRFPGDLQALFDSSRGNYANEALYCRFLLR
jgi:hypothetical protein